MWKVTRKGLAGHKLRFVLTALAVVLGVSFISGTLVLYGDDPKDVRRPVRRTSTAAPTRRCARTKCSSGDFGGDQRPNVPASLVDGRARRRRRVEAAGGNIQAYAQVVDSNGKAIGGSGPPTLRRRLGPEPEAQPVPPRRRHRARDRQPDRHRQAHGRQGQVPRRRPGHGPHDEGAAASIDLVGIAQVRHRRQPRGRVDHACSRLPRCSASRTSPNEFSQISVVAKPGVSQDAGRQRHRADAGRQRSRVSTR